MVSHTAEIDLVIGVKRTIERFTPVVQVSYTPSAIAGVSQGFTQCPMVPRDTANRIVQMELRAAGMKHGATRHNVNKHESLLQVKALR